MANLPIHVAVVDDDASVRKALARLLAASSFATATYPSARAFLDALETARPECLLVDLHMPEVTGLELQRELVRAGIRIPTIVITAYNDPGLRERCQAAGAIAVLLKPLDGATLIGAIHAALAGAAEPLPNSASH